MTKKSLTILLAIFAVVALAVPAQAVLVTRNASAVFYDDFEGPASSSPPNNGAYPGDWTQTGLGAVFNQANTPGNVPPYEGLQVLRWGYGQGGSSNGTRGTFASALTTGDVLHAEMAVWLLMPGSDWSFGFVLEDSSNTGVANGYYTSAAVIRNSVSGNNYTNLSWQAGWNILEIDHVLGSTDLTYSLNGTSDTRGTPVITEIAAIQLREGGPGGDYLVDAAGPIPEPATMLVLALGAGLALLRRR